MYKITINKSVNEVTKQVIIETEDVELVKDILKNEDVLNVDSDVPNRNIDKEYQDLVKLWEEEVKKFTNPSPWKIGDDHNRGPFTPFTVTC